MAIKSYDLVIALTGGGPGTATELPATFMYSYTFTRNQMGIGAASAVIMLMSIAAIMVPASGPSSGRKSDGDRHSTCIDRRFVASHPHRRGPPVS